MQARPLLRPLLRWSEEELCLMQARPLLVYRNRSPQN